MDPRNDIREFLVSRRARITPEQAGLPAYGTNRRVKGLRREEAAMLAGISAEYYVRLERGNLRGVSEDVLDGIGRALQLDEAERTHLFDLARAANTSTTRRGARRTAQERVRPVVQRILDSLVGAPAFVRNERLDVLANVNLHRTGVKRIHHPVVGELTLEFKSLDLPGDPGQKLLVYSAEPGSPTRQALDLLASWSSTPKAPAIDVCEER